MYAIAFDLNTTKLAQVYPGPYPENAYDDIRRVFAEHKFARQQGSVYFGQRGVTNPIHCVLAVQEVSRRYPWFRFVVKDIRMLRIEEQNDLMPAISPQADLDLRSANSAA